MYRIFFVLLSTFLMGVELDAQQMNWVPGDQVTDANYTDGTDCDANLLCYTLAYTPAQTGVLTSYTTNFMVDCDGGNSAIVSNRSLLLNDNSSQEEACEEAGLLLLHSSGNSGTITVKAGQTTYLHEICLQTAGKSTELQFVADKIGGMTTSLDLRDGNAMTERPEFRSFIFKHNRSACDEAYTGEVVNTDLEGVAGFSGEGDGISLYLSPNPAISDLQIQFHHTAAKANYRLLDATGRQLRKWEAVTRVSQTIDVAELPSGLYYLNVSTAKDELSQKFVIQR
ncbi:T9SS type A sorting domain-containing protein [Neolewinella agarilytica]|uniref:T9SS type A sorting domain-containing protein n=1 Tax=Neolewinella agarilytica TaxID=478744 RepID=UPI002352A99C|nr:T9SS type A sorting domain-containing protein [Neolewinella agarilytica]